MRRLPRLRLRKFLTQQQLADEVGVDLNTIRELMGHKTLAMTLRYPHLSQSHLRQAVEQLDDGGSFGGSTSENARAPRGTHPASKSAES